MGLPAAHITKVWAREILDCRGLPTVQVDVVVRNEFLGRADVPAGRSTGGYEARELRDGGGRFGGYGVLGAVKNVRERIAPALEGRSVFPQRAIDELLLDLDGTPDKSSLGSNAMVGASLAVARATAAFLHLPLYLYLNADAHVLPVPQVNLINGGKHASNDLDFQEFIIMPMGAQTFSEAMQLSTEVNLVLRELLLERFGKVALNIGDEGGFVPPISHPEAALELLHVAVDKSGYADHVVYGLDCAATHLYEQETQSYRVAGRQHDRSAMIDLYRRLIADYGIVSIEDPLEEDDFEGFALITRDFGIQVVGDDLFATNPVRLKRGIGAGAANSLLWKVNQIGTLTEALLAADIAKRHGYGVVVSERSGETEDAIISDLCLALNATQIKTGAPVRGERTAKYNALLRIEEELGGSAVYAGSQYRDRLLTNP